MQRVTLTSIKSTGGGHHIKKSGPYFFMDIILFQGLLLWTQQYTSMCIKVVQATISFSRSTLHYGILGYFKFWNILKWLIYTYIIILFWILCHALAFSSICIYFWANSPPSCVIFTLLILFSQINEHMIQTQIMGLWHRVVSYQHFRRTYCFHLSGLNTLKRWTVREIWGSLQWTWRPLSFGLWHCSVS